MIFDEVITGFRLALGGAQERFGIQPDLTCLGKIIGGGLPVGAYGGQAEIMDLIAPDGPVYQAGTLSGNPLAMAAGLAMLKVVRRPGFYADLEKKSAWFGAEMEKIVDGFPVPAVLNRIGSMMTCFFTVGSGHGFYFRHACRYRCLWTTLPADACRRCLAGAIPV